MAQISISLMIAVGQFIRHRMTSDPLAIERPTLPSLLRGPNLPPDWIGPFAVKKYLIRLIDGSNDGRSITAFK
jgi:hypothetical protein